MNRHLSRSIVLQTLFEFDFNGLVSGKGKIKDTKTALLRNSEEFAPGIGDFSFIQKLIDNILEKEKI